MPDPTPALLPDHRLVPPGTARVPVDLRMVEGLLAAQHDLDHARVLPLERLLDLCQHHLLLDTYGYAALIQHLGPQARLGELEEAYPLRWLGPEVRAALRARIAGWPEMQRAACRTL